MAVNGRYRDMGRAAFYLLWIGCVAAQTLPPQTISVDQYPLRSGCEESDTVVQKLPSGTPVQIRFAIAGGGRTCYKVGASTGGTMVEGWVFSEGLTSVEAFDKARRDAREIDLPRMAERQMEAASKTVGRSGRNAGIGEAIQLLDAKQPSQALKLVEAALAASPRDPQLLALAGLAAYRADDPGRAVEFMRSSIAIQPNADLEQFAARLDRELKADTSGARMFGTRFILRYDGATLEGATARTLVDTLEQEYSRISNQLGCRMEERLTTIVQTPNAYRRTTNSAEWSGGQYDGSKIRVALFEPGGAGPQTRQAFAHELVHACLASLGSYPAWLHEGLAQKLSGESLGPADREMVHAQVRAKMIPKLEDLAQDWSRMSTARAQLAYRYSLEAAQILFESFQGYGINNILRNPNLLAEVTTQIDRKMEQ